jgi:CheY-like chemotaxis protein
MALALICSAVDVSAELGHTLLWRAGMQRQMAKRAEEARTIAAAARPSLVVIDRDLPGADGLIVGLRADAATRSLSIVVLARGDFQPVEVELLEAGANSILRLPPDHDWDERLMRLIEVPVRKETRFSVFFKVETSAGGDPAPIMATAMNLSVSGMLLETPNALAVGDDLHLQFRLPELDELVKATARVVRQAGPRRFGLEFEDINAQGAESIRRYVAQTSSAGLTGW